MKEPIVVEGEEVNSGGEQEDGEEDLLYGLTRLPVKYTVQYTAVNIHPVDRLAYTSPANTAPTHLVHSRSRRRDHEDHS